MKFRIFSCLSMLFCTGAFSQNTNLTINHSTNFLFLNNEAKNSKDVVEGSPYFVDEFLPSEVIGYSGVTPPIRYNAVLDEMEYMKDGKKYYVTKKDSIEIKLLNKKYSFLEYETKKGNENGYLVILHSSNNDKFSLYKKEKIVLMPEYIPNSSYADPKPAHYKIESDKFYIGYDLKIVSMFKSKKEIIKLVPNNSAQVEAYFKENKVSFDNEYSLIQLVKFLNSLK
jgi:hypothetical protein